MDSPQTHPDKAPGALWQKALGWCGHPDRPTLTLLLAAGLLIRLAGAFLFGTQDVEWWKAWGSYTVKHDLLSVYAGQDREILETWRSEGLKTQTLDEGIRVFPTQTVISFQPHRYFRTKYFMPQPPLYIYSLYLSTSLYSKLRPELPNTRLFNFITNLEPIAASAGITGLLYVVIKGLRAKSVALLTALVYWLHPLALLNSTVQGYRDPLCALFALASICMLHRARLTPCYVLLVLSFMYKPQGILILPVIFWVGLREHTFADNFKAWIGATAAFFVVCLPYLVSSRFVGMILGVLSNTQHSGDLSRQAMNFWWPIQFFANAHRLATAEGTSLLAAVTGTDARLFHDLPNQIFINLTGLNPTPIGMGMLILFTGLNCWMLQGRVKVDRSAVFGAAALQIYAYFMLRAGAQVNHYFNLVPLLVLATCLAPRLARVSLLVFALFLLQDLIFYGLGRDWNPGQVFLSQHHLGWLTILLALANGFAFARLFHRFYFSVTAPQNT